MSAGRRSQAQGAVVEVPPVAGGQVDGALRQRTSLRGAILRTVQVTTNADALARLSVEQATIQARHLAQNWARWQEQHHLMMGREMNEAVAAAAEQMHIDLEHQVLEGTARLDAQLRIRLASIQVYV